MPAFEIRNLWPMLKETFNDWMEDKAMRLAAALALYTILSLAPLLIISIKILSIFFGDEAASGQVAEQVQGLIGGASAQAIQDMIKNASQPGAGTLATIISVIILLFTASGVFGELQDSMNTIWEVKLKPNLGISGWIRARFLSIGMVLAIAFLLMVSLFVSTVLTTAVDKITGNVTQTSSQVVTPGGQQGEAGDKGQPQAQQGEEPGLVTKIFAFVIDFVVSFVVITLLFAMIFKFLPDVKIEWADVLLGAAVTAALFKLGQYALAIYFRFGSTTSAYGAAGSLVAVLLWAYYSAQILFFGAEFTQVYMRSRGKQIQPTENAVKVTEQERAQQGMPSPQRMGALAMATAPAPPLRRLKSDTETRTRPVVLAGSGLAAGLVMGAIGARQKMKSSQRITSREAAAVDLDRRLNDLEGRLRRIVTATRKVGMPVEPQPSIWREFKEGFEKGARG